MNKSIGFSILLITLGVLFLLDNLKVLDVSIAYVIKTYWPIILIWIGAEKLYRNLK